MIRTLTKLRAKHAEWTAESTGGKACTFGIDGDKGTIVDMKELGVWEAYAVKVQSIKTAVESAAMLLRIDDIVSGLSQKGGPGAAAGTGTGVAPQQTTRRTLPKNWGSKLRRVMVGSHRISLISYIPSTICCVLSQSG